MRSLKDNLHAVVDLGIVITLGIAFAALMVCAYIIFILRDEIYEVRPAYTDTGNVTAANINSSVLNITTGWDSALNLILVAITIIILALAIGALLMLRGRR